MAMRISRLVGGALALALAVGGCGKPFGGRVVYQGDYPHYRSAAELMDRASLVIEATVARPRVDKLYPDGGGSGPKADPRAGAPEPVEDTAVVITVWSATIKVVHKGPNKPGDVVDVHQVGGLLDGVSYEQDAAVPFREGDTYLLFLETYPDSSAALLNPYQAHYEVDPDGTFRPVSADNQIAVTGNDL
ncbi:hypothetical protein AB0J74_35790 [Asanoa sp. NPDC049573]|uniref:hypothetical protein n=1 Tax=Asanoa sp. NPDC049573 TaxID=3155396 RepID=UPI003443E964